MPTSTIEPGIRVGCKFIIRRWIDRQPVHINTLYSKLEFQRSLIRDCLDELIREQAIYKHGDVYSKSLETPKKIDPPPPLQQTVVENQKPKVPDFEPKVLEKETEKRGSNERNAKRVSVELDNEFIKLVKQQAKDSLTSFDFELQMLLYIALGFNKMEK